MGESLGLFASGARKRWCVLSVLLAIAPHRSVLFIELVHGAHAHQTLDILLGESSRHAHWHHGVCERG